MALPTLPWIEYAVVAASLLVTMVIGLWFSRSSNSLEEYMFGGRSMTVLPIVLSTSATLLSSNVMVAGSQELYLYGSQVYSVLLGMLAGCGAGYIYLPVLYSIRSVSLYEFFDRRFNGHVRKFVSVMNAFDMLQHTMISLYIPSLIFSQASGISTTTLAFVVSVVCFVYTVSGGLRAVAWADSFQMCILIFCTIYFFVVALIKSGGFYEVYRKNNEGERLEFFNFDPSPFQRLTFWTGLGTFFTWGPYYYSAPQHQRYQALPNIKHAKQVILYSTILMMIITSINISLGLLAYAYYAGCDPVLAKKDIQSYNTIIPYFINEISKGIPGMSGLFYACVLATGLSTITSLWNTLACTIHEDLIKPFTNSSAKASRRIIIGLVVVISVLTVVGVHGLGSLGVTVLQGTIIMKTVFQAATFVVFHCGMFIPWVNWKGAITGGLTAAGLSLFVVVGTIQVHEAGLALDLPKFLTAEYCTDNTTFPSVNSTYGVKGYGSHSTADESVFWMFKLSLYFYQVPGIVLGIVVAMVISFLVGGQRLDTVDSQMIAPQMRWLLGREKEADVTETRV